MAELTVTRVTIAASDNIATQPDELVRLDQLDARLAAVPSGQHTHVSGDITDFDEAVADRMGEVLTDSDSVDVVVNDPADEITLNVRIAPGAHLAITPSGLTDSGISSGDHTHPELHDPVTVTDTDSVDLTLVGQDLSADVRVFTGGGLQVTDSGLQADFGTGAGQVAEGDHTHAEFHDPVTVIDTNSIKHSLNVQELSSTVELDTNPGPNGRPLGISSGGLYAPVGESGLAPWEHTHDNATQAESGFLSAADKRKLDAITANMQPESNVLYHRHDYLIKDEYVGGRYKWGQRMEITGANVVARAPLSFARLSLEVDGTLTGSFIDIPAGTVNTEVQAEVTLDDEFIDTGEYARWLCSCGVDDAQQVPFAASMVSLAMTVRPALDTLPELRINSGGSATGAWVDDDMFDGGSAVSTTTSIDTSGVSNPAPQAVYQTARQKLNDTAPLNYTLTGLGRGVEYLVRLHFAEFTFDNIGDQVFDITVIGETTHTQLDYDVIQQAGAKYKAVVREFTLEADSDGQIVVRLTPKEGLGGGYHLAINGIEVIGD